MDDPYRSSAPKSEQDPILEKIKLDLFNTFLKLKWSKIRNKCAQSPEFEDVSKFLRGLLYIAAGLTGVWCAIIGLYHLGTLLNNNLYHIKYNHNNADDLMFWTIGAGTIIAPFALLIFIKLCYEIGSPKE
jgi:hypothetical protein